MALVKCENCSLILTEAERECPGCGEKLPICINQSHEVRSAVDRARKLLQSGKLADAEIIALNTARRYHATCDSLELLADICTLKGETKQAKEYRAQAASLRAAEAVQAGDGGTHAATLRMTAASWGMIAVIVFVMLSAVTTFVLYQSGASSTGRAGIIHVIPSETQVPMPVHNVNIPEPRMATTTVAPPVRQIKPETQPVAPAQTNTATATAPVTDSATTATVSDVVKPD